VLKESEGVADTNIIYTGVCDPRLRTLKEVAIDRLKMKDSFPTKHVLEQNDDYVR
jgi:hypothetical protein